MTILDRYLLKKFIAILFYTTLAFIIIFVVIDLIEHLDKFLAGNATVWNIAIYYIYYIPYIILLTLPVNMLLSSLFSLGSMAQYNELAACLTSGISLYRLVLPILLLALIVSGLSGLANEKFVAQINRERLDFFRYEIRNQKRNNLGTQRQISVQDIDNRQISILYFDAKKQRANKVGVVWREKNRIRERWDIKYMDWKPEENGWLMRQVTQRQLTDSNETITRIDSLWYTDTNVFPDDLVDLQIKPEEMNFEELNRFVEKMEALGADARKWLVDLYLKISYPLSCFIIVLFGAPLASRKRRSGPALGFALALLISFVYFLFLRSGQVLGHNGTLEPWIGAWIGNIVFGIGGITMMLLVRK